MTMRTVVAVAASASLLPVVLVGILGAAKPAGPREGSVEPSSKYDVGAYRKDAQAGVDRFLEAHAVALEAGDEEATSALDAVCGQFQCIDTHLFWHTDLGAAKAQAVREHKPILSLHLLGRFDERLSCANSRFFRKILYPDPAIAAHLRESYVLHWKTVRPVPKINIDFGDGRTMARTITGNSAHYVLDETGRVLDVLPGMYSPKPFLAALTDAAALSKTVSAPGGATRAERLKQWHAAREERAVRTWTDALNPPAAERAHIERSGRYAITQLEARTGEADWKRMAAMDRERAEFAESVRSSVRAPSAWESGQIARTKAVMENPMERAVRGVESTVLQDSLQNELHLHARIHGWFAHGEVSGDIAVATLNERVYRELFKAPLDDPWYGLAVPEQWRELDGTIATAPRANRPVR